MHVRGQGSLNPNSFSPPAVIYHCVILLWDVPRSALVDGARMRQREVLYSVKYVIAPLQGAIGRPQDYFPGALAAHVAGPLSRSVVVNIARTSEQLQDPRP